MLNTLREHRALLAFAFFFAGLFQVLILTLVVGADLLGMVEQFYSQFPPQMQTLFGEQFMAQFSVNGAMAFGYNHPLVIVLLAIVAVLLPARHIAGEVEAGTLELLFAMPVKRFHIGLSLWLASALALWALVAGCWVGTACGLMLFPEARGVPVANVVKVGLSLWLLMFTISSYTMLISSYSTEGGKATLRAAAVTLVFYWINLAVIMWPAIDFLRPFTVFHYHQPQQLMMNQPLLGWNLAVLCTLALAAGGLAIRQTSRRDVPG
jgi:ABC-type transport system involved in multi-copper enzyme maturation permease subunit